MLLIAGMIRQWRQNKNQSETNRLDFNIQWLRRACLFTLLIATITLVMRPQYFLPLLPQSDASAGITITIFGSIFCVFLYLGLHQVVAFFTQIRSQKDKEYEQLSKSIFSRSEQ
jgi:hypothetical protein